MAEFLSNLWTSILTPGPTPTLLLATNATFACLQLLLVALLIATYSIHFAVLSVLCGGLWYSINWFARELTAQQAKETEKKAVEDAREKRRDRGKWRTEGEVGDSADDEGEDTEVEAEGKAPPLRKSGVAALGRGGVVSDDGGRMRDEIKEAMGESPGAKSGVASGVEKDEMVGAAAEARQRRVEPESGEVSGDSEWERVSQEGDR